MWNLQNVLLPSCLASGKKDPCVWFGQCTSKRVEQLVWLKSIYWAFKQSGAAFDENPTKVANNLGAHNDNTRRLNPDAIYSSENSNYVGHRESKLYMEGDSEHLFILPYNQKVDQYVIG